MAPLPSGHHPTPGHSPDARTTPPATARVAVLMATFDGARFIDSQIASILDQQGVEVRIFVSDDGSRDDTLARIARWPAQRVSLLPPVRSGGAGQNFLRLLRDAPWQGYDFVAFSDQDDIWHPDKLARAIAGIASRGLDAYSSNVRAFWPDGRRTLVRKAQPLRRLDHLFEAGGPGNTYVLPRATAHLLAARLAAAPAEALARIALHDWLIYAVVRGQGLRWWIDPEPSLDYRQHATNVAGTGNTWPRIRRRLGLLLGGWYLDQLRAIAAVAAITGPEVGFLDAPSWRGLPHMLRHLPDFRRKTGEAMLLAPAFCAFALRGGRAATPPLQRPGAK